MVHSWRSGLSGAAVFRTVATAPTAASHKRCVSTSGSGAPRVGVVGAGPAGITAAVRLRERGYNNVVLLEQGSRAGGKCRTIEVDSTPVEVGTAIMFPSDVLNDLRARVGLMGSEAEADFPRMAFKSMDTSVPRYIIHGSPHVQVSWPQKIYGMLKAKQLAKGVESVGLRSTSYLSGAPASELLAQATYLEQLVGPRFKNSNATPAGGDVAALYLQKYLAYFDRFPLARKLNSIYPKLRDGNSRLWERLAADLDVRFKTDIRRVTVGMPGGAAGPGSPRISVETDGETLEFDRLIWACDLRGYARVAQAAADAVVEHSAPHPWNISPQEHVDRTRSLFSKVDVFYRAVVPARVRGLPSSLFWFLADDADKYDTPSMIVSAQNADGQGTGLYNFYCWLSGPPANVRAKSEELRSNIEAAGRHMGFEVTEFVGEPFYWDWQPHFSRADVQEGVFGAIEELQGAQGVSFCGEALSAAGLAHVAEYSAQLVDQQFAVQPVVSPVAPKSGMHLDVSRVTDGRLDFEGYSRKDVGVDVDRLYVAPPDHPEWAAEPEYTALRFAYRQLVETYGAQSLAGYWERMKPPAEVPASGPASWLNRLVLHGSIAFITVFAFLKKVLPSGGLRSTHELGLGCHAQFSIRPNQALPAHPFFSSAAEYGGRVRFAQSSYHDNAALDVKSLSLQMRPPGSGATASSDSDSVFDLVMQTCPYSVIWSLRFFMRQIVPFVRVRGDAEKLAQRWPDFACAFWPGSIRLASRHLESYAENTVYSMSPLHLTDDSGRVWAIRFRALPAEFREDDPEPSHWMHVEDIAGLSRRNTRLDDDTRPPDYLFTEIRQRLSRAPVTFRLQAQVRAVEPHHSTTTESMYHNMKPWPAALFPWHTFGELRVTRPIADAADAALSVYRVDRLPERLEIPRSFHWNDLTSPMVTRRGAEARAGMLRQWVLRRSLRRGFDPCRGLARVGGAFWNWSPALCQQPAQPQPQPQPAAVAAPVDAAAAAALIHRDPQPTKAQKPPPAREGAGPALGASPVDSEETRRSERPQVVAVVQAFRPEGASATKQGRTATMRAEG